MMKELRYIKLDQPGNSDWDLVAGLFDGMYSDMDKMGLMIPLSPGGAEKWLNTAKNTAGRFGIVVLVKDGDRAIGFAQGMLKFLPDYLGGLAVGSVTHVYVDNGARRSGIGETLIGMLEEWFREKKVQSIELQVIAGNAAAKEFWKKLGYLHELEQYRKICDK
jgi:ribosomal protein S18 acetylase RimI-like enzyme